MTERKQLTVLLGAVLSVSLLAASVTAAGLAYFLHLEQTPGAAALFRLVLAGFGAGAFLFLTTVLVWRKKQISRIKALTGYLEQINLGGGAAPLWFGEDAFSKLQDEIYKTVTELHQTREAALRAKDGFAENLYNIAHQIKTPITALSLSLQMLAETLEEEVPPGQMHKETPKKEVPLRRRNREEAARQYVGQMGRQLLRLTNLEESLLLLSRMDAGALPLERTKTDVYTLLELSAESLQELAQRARVSLEIPEAGEVTIRADLDWTMEAVMNLLKNGIEHTPPQGVVSCTYEENPLYVRIRIRDGGSGFAKEDLPHLFERFYRGRDAAKDGIGIGLALAKSIIEGQNGTVSAENLPKGGACFEIRFYKA